MKILGVIPSRHASSRLPAKALADIAGKPMVVRVWEQAQKCRAFAHVVVATDHEEIAACVAAAGGKALMTGKQHKNGTERCYEALQLTGQYDYVVNIQGDEPFIKPEQLQELANLLNGEVQLATMVSKIKNTDDLWHNGIMKVVFNKRNEALYFSRECIPHVRDYPKTSWLAHGTFYKHVCIYAYRSDVLAEVVKLPPSKLEQTESLEQLRWLEHGYPINIGVTEHESMSVDTPADLEKARRYAEENSL